MAKTAVYSWRLSPDLKLALEEAARNNRESIAELLERIARESLAGSPDDDEEQRRVHAAATKYVGTIDGGDPDRATNARQNLHTLLATRYERAR